jgi:signal transduction histidine kinase
VLKLRVEVPNRNSVLLRFPPYSLGRVAKPFAITLMPAEDQHGDGDCEADLNERQSNIDSGPVTADEQSRVAYRAEIPNESRVPLMSQTPVPSGLADSSIPESGTTRMRVRARLIGLLGDELISDEPVALVELVKNAYDADAHRVEVRFEGEPDAPQRIIITDDGCGMDLNTVLNSWLEPGTTRKKAFDHSPLGRLYQGAKGIGRFAAARLGATLLLETRQHNSDRVVRVLLNWGQFTDDSFLDDVEIDYESSSDPMFAPGTRLTIEDLKRDVWKEASYASLHARLSRLISPFNEISDFEIALVIPGNPAQSGQVHAPELLLKPKYQLTGSLRSSGEFSGSLLIDGQSRPVVRQLAAPGETLECGPFDVEIRGWDRDREGLAPIAERESLTIRQIRNTLDVYSGVTIYRDGFRVHPYGEAGNDWLQLDLRSRQNPVRSLANNQLIAAIRISREGNPELKDRSTREGMVRNPAHTALQDWFVRILALLEEDRYRIRPRKQNSARTGELFEKFDLAAAVNEARNTLGVSHPLTMRLLEAEKQLALGVEQVQEVFSRLLMSAGIGHMVDIVIHEIGAPLGKVLRQLVILERRLEKLLSKDDLPQVSFDLTSVRGWLEQIQGLRERLDPQTPARRGRATSFDVATEIEVTFGLFEALLLRQNIKWQIIKPVQPLMVFMSKAALSQVLANLVDNAIYWVTKKYGSGQGGHIHATLIRIESGFSVTISDDGPGVAEEDRERIFEPYYTTRPSGIGLGLYIARLVIEPYGKLIYREGETLAGASFEAQFEKGVGL